MIKNNSKIKSLSELSKICAELKKQGKTVGLITGCFDILHVGHIEAFKKAKQKVDILVVGLDNDKSIKISKGNNRPVFKFLQRANVLGELESVDFIIKINQVINFGDNSAEKVHEKIILTLQPDALITNILADVFWQKKKTRAKRLGYKFIGMKVVRPSSSSLIINKLESEF